MTITPRQNLDPRGERLQKFLAGAGVASRRKAEEIIRQGRVRVNGQIRTDLGVRIDPAKDQIEVDGRRLLLETPVVLLLNKPVGYVTTLSDPQGRPIVTDLLQGVTVRVFPVGRLDLNSEGALLLTNDGRLSHAILHPSHEVKKTYEATIWGRPDSSTLKRLATGIELDGKKTWPAKLRVVRHSGNQTVVEIIIHEGRKRQVRKMFQAVGHQVIRLKRTAYGGLHLGQLRQGAYRFLGKKDLKKLFLGKIPFTIKNIPD
ncbi:MAG: pseudouridine synthase [Desulfobulbus propionicus]|nr:MAG: pseudouridine synthase [Desulfobulbus propionicus]